MAFDLAAKKAEAEARKAAAALSTAEAKEVADRAEAQAAIDEALAAEEVKAALAMSQWLDEAQEALGPKAKIEPLRIGEDAFVIKYAGAKAYEKFESQIAESNSNKKISRIDVSREYAAASVYSWNGKTDLHGLSSEFGLEFITMLKEFPARCTSIVNVAGGISGMVLEAQKRRG